MDLQIFTLTHKDFTTDRFDPSYMTLVYNSECHNDMDVFNDRVLYDFYMIYDIYKNQDKYIKPDTKYIGICHYRRYWDMTYDEIINAFNEGYDVILGIPTVFYDYQSVLSQYNACHDLFNIDMNNIRSIINDLCPEYLNTFDTFINQNTMSICDIYIVSVEIFNKLISWLEPIIKEFLKINNIHNYGDMYKFVVDHPKKFPTLNYSSKLRYDLLEYHAKIAGFIVERLINVFFLYNYKNIKYSTFTILNENTLK